MAWASKGGGDGNVGTPGKTMEMLSFDDKTRPISRSDLFNFLKDPKNTTDYEKKLMNDAMVYGVSGSIIGFVCGYQLSKLLPFRWLEKKTMRAPKHLVKFSRIAFGFCGAAFPFFWVQQWAVGELLKLDETSSALSFHAKRLLVTQRSSLLFTRSQIREVTKEEQAKLGQQNVTIRQQESRAIGGKGTSVDVDLAMQQQVLTPVAQTGYKKL